MKTKPLFQQSRAHRCLGASLLVGALVACQSGNGDPSKDPEPPPFIDTGAPLAPGPEQTIGHDFDEAKLSFAQRAGGFRGSFRTHQVDVSNGLIEVVAKDPPSATTARQSPVLALQTAEAWRGEDALETAPIASGLTAPNVVTTIRGGFTETVHNLPEGIEQSWHFEAAPVGEGDLMITVEVSGLDYQGSTDGGLHFRRAGELGLRYGHGTWIEADGDRWSVQASYDNGRIVLAVPAEIVASSAYPAVLDPVITPELLNDVPFNAASGADNYESDIAGNGSAFLSVWQDRRNTRNDDIWGARINDQGQVLDARGIKIFENATTVESNPVVAAAGTGWIVAWESAGNIAAARVASDGTVTQLGTIAGTAADETSPAIAGSGSGALLTWTTDDSDVYAAAYNGTSFGAAFAVAASTTAVERTPAVAADASGNYLVLFQEGASNDNIRGQRVSGGAVSGAAFDVSTESGAQTSPSVSFNGDQFVAVWATSLNNVQDIRGARISTAGAVLDASPGMVVSGAAEQQTAPDISCNATECLVAWQDRRSFASTNFDLYGARIAHDGLISAEASYIVGDRGQISPTVAVLGSQWYLTWTDNRDGELRHVFGSRFTAASGIADAVGTPLALGWNREASPVVTRTPSISTVTWATAGPRAYSSVYTRFNSSGGQLDDAARAIIPASASSTIPTGSVFANNNLLTVWTDNRGPTRDIYAARINPTTGATIDSNGFAITTAALDQAGAKIASNGTTSLVVWQDRRSNSSFDIYGALVSGTGTIAVPEFLICANAGDQTRPAVAYDSVNGAYLVVWTDAQGQDTNDIRGARVSAAGALLDANCGVAITSATGSQSFPDLAFSGTRFLAVWEDRRTDAEGDIYGARVSLAGGAITVQDPSGLAIASLATEQTTPTVSGYGGNFVVAWRDARNLATTKLDVYGTRVIAASGVVEPAFAIANSTDDEQAPDISDGPLTSNPASIAYLRTRPDLDSVRVQLRRITFQTSTGGSCSQNAQCASGFCVDSRCCDTACGGGSLSDCQACSVARGAATDGVCGVLAGPNRVICRNYARIPGICDLREYCDGVNAACPPDLGTNQGRVCNSTTGTVCPSNSVAGAPHICP